MIEDYYLAFRPPTTNSGDTRRREFARDVWRRVGFIIEGSLLWTEYQAEKNINTSSMREFKVVKHDQQHAKRVFRKLKLRLNIEKPSYSSTTKHVRPYDVLDAPAPLPAMDGAETVERSFETLLSKWHTAVAIREHPEFEEWSSLATPSNGPILFRIIEDMVPETHQFALMKESLQSDLQSHRASDYPYHTWRDAWNDVLGCGHWEEAKDILRDDGVITRTAGDVFLSAALVVLAENQLRDCQARMEFPDRFSQPLSRSRDTSLCEEDDLEEEICGCRPSQPYAPDMKYKDILDDFKHTKTTVDASFYKYALEVYETQGHESLGRESVADEYRQRYLELTNPSRGPKGHTDLAYTPEPESSTSSHTLSASSRPHTSSSISSELSPVTTRSAVAMLVSKWKSPDEISSFTEYAQSLLSLDGHEISIFEFPSTGNDNLFGVIESSVAMEKQIPIVRQLLDAFANTAIPNARSSVTWWRTVYNSPSWSEFLIRLNRSRHTAILESIMSAAGAKLFLEAATLSVGETLLQQSIEEMKILKKVHSGPGADRYGRMLKQYNSIIGEFNVRKIDVDDTWLQNLLNVM